MTLFMYLFALLCLSVVEYLEELKKFQFGNSRDISVTATHGIGACSLTRADDNVALSQKKLEFLPTRKRLSGVLMAQISVSIRILSRLSSM
jgi:hypothetical protein